MIKQRYILALLLLALSAWAQLPPIVGHDMGRLVQAEEAEGIPELPPGLVYYYRPLATGGGTNQITPGSYDIDINTAQYQANGLYIPDAALSTNFALIPAGWADGFENKPISFGLWYNPSKDESQLRVLLSEYDNRDAAKRHGWWVRIPSTDDIYFIRSINGSAYRGRRTGPQSITSNQWVFVGVSCTNSLQNNGYEIYLNGVRSDVLDFGGGTATDHAVMTNDLQIGGTHTFYFSFEETYFDHIMIFTNALTSNQWVQAYDATKTNKTVFP